MRTFKDLRAPIISAVQSALNADLNLIQSLKIDKREPNTMRYFFFLGEERICLHHFTKAADENCFPHGHSWLSQVVVMEGTYLHYMKDGVPLDVDATEDFKDGKITPTLLTAGASYSITSPHTWHKVVPKTDCYTLMINSKMWDEYNAHCKFTKGKELVEVPDDIKRAHLQKFLKLLEATPYKPIHY